METNTIKDTTLNFLREKDRLTAVLATATMTGESHAAVVYYFVDEDFNFYFLTATNTKKHQNLLANPQSSIVIGFGPSQTTIQGNGTATLLEKASDEENHTIALIKKRLQDHNGETWPVFQLDTFDSESIAVFKFTPQSLHLLNLEQDNGLTVTTDDVHQII